jgi:hypothetical protein
MLEIQQHIDTRKSAGDMNVLGRVCLIIYSLITQKSISGTEPLDIELIITCSSYVYT